MKGVPQQCVNQGAGFEPDCFGIRRLARKLLASFIQGLPFEYLLRNPRQRLGIVISGEDLEVVVQEALRAPQTKAPQPAKDH